MIAQENEQLPDKKTVILDGTRHGEKHLDSILALLINVLRDKGAAVQRFKLQDIKINHCIGCFSCWLKTPGRCIHADAGADILQAIQSSNTLIFFTPIVFGGYSSELKKIVDRFLPMALPFFSEVHGETRHPLRYPKSIRLLGIGVQPCFQKKTSKCFKMLVGRNAANFHSRYAAEVFSSMDSPEVLQSQFQALLSRRDESPGRDELTSLMNDALPAPDISPGNRKALLIVGSPKIKLPSTSAILGNYLLEQLRKHGWETESLPLGKNLLGRKGQDDLCTAVTRSDTIIIAFPLYCDTLPFLLTKAFEVIALHKEGGEPKKILAVVNNGFPESYQNNVALAICRNFAVECGMTWAGGLAMGAGEGLLSGHPVTAFKGLKGLKRPPLYYVNRALKITAAALAEGHSVPKKAVQLIAKKPIPLISFDLWRRLYMKRGKMIWEKEALKNGV
ncbi:MAG: hypothetical protein D3924_15240, partial [Candidatus Electrothrix sp. AR4]|nr:hypothetical protein [Candidatus Electrothrix sp. AR4]